MSIIRNALLVLAREGLDSWKHHHQQLTRRALFLRPLFFYLIAFVLYFLLFYLYGIIER
jgi:hypothetical protein